MRKFQLGAISVSALMLATAACGNSDNAYESAESETAEEEADRVAQNDSIDPQGYDAAAGRSAMTPSTELADAAPPEDAAGADTYTEPSETQTASAPTSKTRAEIETLATSTFESADADGDGVIDREEYVQLALASARDFERFIDEPAKLMSVNPVTETDGAAAPDEMETADSSETGMTGETPDDQAAAAQTAETETSLDAVETADIEVAASSSFDEAAGGDDAMTAEELRTAFLARFEEADEDGDEELDATELRTFAALTRGERDPDTSRSGD